MSLIVESGGELNLNQSNLTNTIYASLNNLLKNGIEIDRNLRQPTYYSRLNVSNELQVEIFSIVSQLLTNQKLPLWLSQRIAWFYSKSYLQETIDSFDEEETNEGIKIIKRERLVEHLRKSISKIIAAWFGKKADLNDPKNILFSFLRFESKRLKNLQYSEFGLKNKRRIMEDKTAIYENIELFTKLTTNESNHTNGQRSNAIFGVFDGHCGADCSQYVSTHLPMYIIQHEKFNNESDLEFNNLLTESFQAINKRFSEKAQRESLKSGTTCCLAIVSGVETSEQIQRSIDVAWCGDTQFCLVKNGQINFITEEHKPNNPSEKKRIEDTGGTVSYVSEAWRVNGSLAVSRSFGDLNFQPSVTAEPQLKHLELDGTEDYFIIGCDGLWEGLEASKLLELIYENRNEIGVNIAELLVRKALENGSMDNITAIFVLLRDDLSQIEMPK